MFDLSLFIDAENRLSRNIGEKKSAKTTQLCHNYDCYLIITSLSKKGRPTSESKKKISDKIAGFSLTPRIVVGNKNEIINLIKYYYLMSFVCTCLVDVRTKCVCCCSMAKQNQLHIIKIKKQQSLKSFMFIVPIYLNGMF